MEYISIAILKQNPNNPRIIKDDKFKKLVKSIQEFPEMLEKRPIVVNKEMMVLGGNMRLKACIEAGIKDVPVIVADWPEEKQREFIIKDNVSGGEWEWNILSNEWDIAKLEEWGLDIPDFKIKETEEHQSNANQSFFINIRCDNENHCKELYEKFILLGLDVKIVT
jgi:ParB-like chromosome segregation protein Spo0J